MRLVRGRHPTKLDRRRERSRAAHREGQRLREDVVWALAQNYDRHHAARLAYRKGPERWPPGKDGEVRQWRGIDYEFHTVRRNGEARGVWFIDRA